MQDLDGITKDYKNLIHVFYKHFGYTVAFYDNENKLQYCNKNPANTVSIFKKQTDSGEGKNIRIRQKKLNTSKFKLKWTDDDVYDFIDEIIHIISFGKHDSLLFFISSHGDSDGVILSSDCDEISLLSIFAQFFGDKCAIMLNKPKVFFVDACRGCMQSRVKIPSIPKTAKSVPNLFGNNENKYDDNADNINIHEPASPPPMVHKSKTMDIREGASKPLSLNDNDNDHNVAPTLSIPRTRAPTEHEQQPKAPRTGQQMQTEIDNNEIATRGRTGDATGAEKEPQTPSQKATEAQRQATVAGTGDGQIGLENMEQTQEQVCNAPAGTVIVTTQSVEYFAEIAANIATMDPVNKDVNNNIKEEKVNQDDNNESKNENILLAPRASELNDTNRSLSSTAGLVHLNVDVGMNFDHDPRRSTLANVFHTQANCRFIYANPEGYAAVDGGSKGGYLIQAIKHVFMKKNAIEKENLDSIINQIRFKTRELVGKGVMQNVEDVNHMNFDVYFKKCTKKSKA